LKVGYRLLLIFEKLPDRHCPFLDSRCRSDTGSPHEGQSGRSALDIMPQ